jgi:hypothetical protein
MHELTSVGLDAMAEELLRLASNGEQSWDQATPALRENFRDYVDSMVDVAAQAEAERAADKPTREEHDGKAEDHQAEHHVPEADTTPIKSPPIEKVPVPGR